MKYPAQQFETLVMALQILNEFFDLHSMHESNLHYLVYQQFTEGQTHNWLYVNENSEITRQHKITDLTGWTKLIDIKGKGFDLYPNNTNDDNITTAIKKALKTI